MFKLKATSLVFIFITMTSQQTLAMQGAASRTTGQLAKHFAKKGFSGLMTTLHWTMAAGTAFSHGIQEARILWNEKQVVQNLENANEPVSSFISAKIEALSNKQLDGVKINRFAPDHSIASARSHILIAPAAANEITKALEANDLKSLNKWSSILEHEYSHMAHEDIAVRMVIDFASPFVTHKILKVLRGRLPFIPKTTTFWKEQALKLPAGLIKSDINTAARASIYQAQEYRADNDVTNEETTLYGLKDYLVNAEQAENRMYEQLRKQLYMSEQHFSIYKKYYLDYLKTHPDTSKRIEKVDQRIKAIRKEQFNQFVQEVRQNYQNLTTASDQKTTE